MRTALAAGGAALALVIGAGGGYALGHEGQAGTVDRQQARLDKCAKVDDAMYRSMQTLLAAFQANQDTEQLQAALGRMTEDSSALDSEFGTHDFREIMAQCSGK